MKNIENTNKSVGDHDSVELWYERAMKLTEAKSQKELAEKLETSETDVSRNRKAGKFRPDYLVLLADKYKINPNHIMYGSTPIHLDRNGSEPKPNILSQKDFDNLSDSTMRTLFLFIKGAYYPGRTQNQFAQELGVTKNTLQDLLTGKTKRTDTVSKIHGALNANPGVPADIITLFYKVLDKPAQHDQKAYPVAGQNETPDTADEHHAAYSCPGHTYEKYCKHRFNAIEETLQELLLQKKHDNTEEHSSPDNSGRKTG